ncbi:MAG: alcohol dehydrogenase catalytic domain-containing protein [Nitrospirota bacterium]
MLANFIVGPGKIELRKIELPEPARGELLVKIKAALTCGTDLKAFMRGHPMIPMPHLFGHEFSGVIASVGKGVNGFRETDEIMSVHSAPCLKCSYCGKKAFNLCEKIMDTKVLGAFAEYILLPAHIVKQNVFHKPENITFEEAAFLEPLSCVVHSIESLNIQKGDKALVIGAGPIGLLHLLLLREKGVLVTVMDKHSSKLRIAKQLGAHSVFTSNPLLPPFRKGEDNEIFNVDKSPNKISPSLGKLSSSSPFRKSSSPPFGKLSSSPPFGKGGYGGISEKCRSFIGFDYVFECTGRPEVWESSVNYVRRGGTVILFGGCPSGTRVSYDTGRLHYDEITLKGVFHYTPTDVRKAYKLLCSGKLEVSKLISGIYSLRNIKKAFDKLSKGEGIKYAIIP